MAKQQLTGGSSSGFEKFFAAIGGQESGGDYGAVNGRTGASGKYQIMPANIGPWSQKYLGYRISVEQFRRDPALQEKLARAVLSDYFRRYGVRGAAAAWYSGNPGRANDYGSIGHGGEPSVGSYVDQVMGRMGQGPPTPKVNDLGHIDGMPVGADPTTPAGSADFLHSHVPPGWAGSGADPFGSSGGDVFGGAGQTPDQAAPTQTAGQAAAAGALGGKLGSGLGPGGGATGLRDKILSSAMSFLGTPYVWGGTAPGGFDCSGLLKYVYNKYGYDLPRISADQAKAGQRVGLGALRPGDLVAWDNSSRNNGADHIAIYAGNGFIIEAPHAGADVRRRKLGQNEGAWGVHLNLPGD